jgi:O-antigen/teichoic acid export membrane protein
MGYQEGVIETERSGPPTAREGAELRRRAVRGGAILIGTKLAVQAFTWLVTIELARILLPFDYGILTTGMVFIGLGDILADAGLGKALVRQKDLGPDGVAEAFTLSLLLSLVLYVALWVLARPAAAFLHSPEIVNFIRVTGAALFVVPFRAVPMALLERRIELGRQSAVFAASNVFQSGLVLTLAVAGFGYWSFAVTMMAGRLLEAVALVRCARWVPRLRWPGSSARELVGFSVHVTISGVAWYVFSQSDFAVVGRIAGPVALGYYSLAFLIISIPVAKLSTTFNQVSFPVFCRLQHDPCKMRQWYLRTTALLGAIGMPLFAGMALVAEDGVVVVLGEKWRPAVFSLRLLSFAGLVMFFNCTLHPLLNALGRPDIPAKYNVTCAVLMPACFALLGSRYGLGGICAVWVVIYPLITGTLVILSRRVTGFGLAEIGRSLSPVCGSVALMAVVVVAAQQSMPDDSRAVVRLALGITAGVVAYGVSLWILARQTVIRDYRLLIRELRGTS